uniref:hypothetical protein n=1 Tax=Devosia albogilva TaxID=429726 RepID=UPI0036DDE2D8
MVIRLKLTKSSDPFIEVEWTNHEISSSVKTNLTGSYNFENILSAICIGDFFDMNPKEINSGLTNYEPKNNRSQLTKQKVTPLSAIFYNANPSSMSAALNNITVLNF